MGSPPKTLQEIAEDIEKDVGNKVSKHCLCRYFMALGLSKPINSDKS